MDNIIDKIKKLIAHERSVRSIGNTAEAETFAGRIQELLLKHKLSASDVEQESIDKDDPVGHSTANLKTKRTKRWMEVLASGIAASFFCKVLMLVGGGTAVEFVFVGRETDRTAALEMFQYLAGVAPKFAKPFSDRVVSKVRAQFEQDLEAQYGRTAKVAKVIKSACRKADNLVQQDFLTGFAVAICKRLTNGRNYLEADCSDGAKGLILRDKLVIENYAQDTFSIGADYIPEPKFDLSGAASAGYEAGMAVSMERKLALGAGEETVV